MGVAAPTLACARLRATRLAVSDCLQSTQKALHHVYETWAGGSAPTRLRGDEIPAASRIARGGDRRCVFGQLGGPDVAVVALGSAPASSSTPA